jgi:hypothetical protein
MSKNMNCSIKLIVTLVAISFIDCGHSQVSPLPQNAKGIWQEDNKLDTKKIDWNAQWIWLPQDIESNVLLARRSFNLSEESSSAILKITASSKYELFINGQYINQGPARSSPHHQSFDILDINSALIKGSNTLAVKVHHQKGKVSYHLKGRAGLLVQLDLESNNISSQIKSDDSWKVSNDPSWDNNAPFISRFQLFVNDKIDFRNKIKNWNQPNFDDHSWNNARPLKRNSGWPAPQKNETATTFITPWTSLVPRDIPYLVEQDIEATNLIFEDEIRLDRSSKHFELNLDHNSIDDSKKNAKILIYDFGTVINGMPKINIEGSKGSKIDIYTAPYILNNTFISNTVDSNFHDQIILSGKEDQWQSMYFKPTRYLAILINDSIESTKINSIGIHQIKYPFELKASISTPEAPWIEELWNASIKTIDVCTTDAFTDNYRERRQYAQTNYYAALGNYWTYGDTALQRRYLIQIAQEQQANGLMPAYAPLAKGDFMVILDSNCLWIRSLYNYYLYSGDEQSVRELLPAAKRLLALLNSFTNEYGMIDSPPYSYWLDHTLNDRRGANLNLNGHYFGALKDFERLLLLLEDKDSTSYTLKIQALSSSLQKYLWDESEQLFADAFIDGKTSSAFSEHGNTMALAEGIATKEQAEKVISTLLKKDDNNFIKRANGMTMVSPAMSYFLHKGLANYGYEQASLELLYSKFSKMLSKESNGTLWEEWWLNGSGRTGEFIGGRTRSDAQTESAFPPDLIASYVLGLEVTKPGMTEIIISQPKMDLKNINAAIPTPQGILKIEWILKYHKSLNLEVPKNITIKLDLNTFDLDQKEIIYLNKTKLRTKDLQYLILKSGNHHVSF